MALAVGTKLGPYAILAPLGAGGMGEVYQASDTRLNRLVAIKVSKVRFSDRFDREARAIAALNHPNICTLYDVGPNAYLAARQGREAAAEFQKILDARNIVVSDPIGALAHLQLGRASALSGDKTKSRTAYQDFLTLWKDADADIPILKQAKLEYATLL